MTRLLLLLAFAGCQPAPVGVRNAEVQRDSTAQCAGLCSSIGLPLDSVVIMADNVGCVCRAVAPAMAPPAATPPTAAPAASSAGGMAAIMMAQQAQQAEAARRAAQQKPK